MKKFDFRLQKLLDIREARERDVQNELAKLVSLQNVERIRQEQYRRSITEQHAKFAAKIKMGRYSYSEARMFERFIDFANRVIVAQQEKIERMEPEIRKVRERLIEASKEKKVVERLKDRRWNEFMYEYNREIARENDDTNQKIFVQRRIRDLQEGVI